MPTEAKDIFEANSRNVREMLCERGLGLYVPPYQRPYGWDKDKVLKLIDDIFNGFAALVDSEESFTFLGTIITIHDRDGKTVHPVVRTELPSKVLTVIDGQQRLTTLLILLIALHNHLRLAQVKLLKSKGKGESLSSQEKWLDEQTRNITAEIAACFSDKHAYGDSPLYPRMIRAFDDQWSKTKENAKYNSAIASLIAGYFALAEIDKPTEYKPQKRNNKIEGEDALIERYSQISKILKQVTSGGTSKEEFEDYPTLKQIADTKHFQRALVNHDFPDDVLDYLRQASVAQEFTSLLSILLLASYTLTRVALTVVKGKNEDYAFTVFESLNTTGEPLTAYETFKPKVVSAEGIDKYEQSESRAHLSEVSNYLSTFKVGDSLQAATRDLLIYFASAETGFRLSKRLADQRRYMKVEFERHESHQESRIAFVRHLRDTATFVQNSWVGAERLPVLAGLPIEATTDAAKLCLSYLRELNHTVAIAPLVRFYSTALVSEAGIKASKVKELEDALKAITAFSALWRASHRGTSGIDQEYREILSGANSITALPPLARCLKSDASSGAFSPIVDVDLFKAELRARLADKDHGGIDSKETFVSEAASIPAYQNSRPTSRLMLLAAYHDSVQDDANLGLIVRGKEAVSPCMTYSGFTDERHLSLEHIAPQQAGVGWNPDLYANKESIHRIGNLVLVQSDANSMLSARPWVQKRILYKALGSATQEQAQNTLRDAKANGLEFGDSTSAIVELSAYMPHLVAIGAKADDDWSLAFVETRAKRLLELAWDELYSWLK